MQRTPNSFSPEELMELARKNQGITYYTVGECEILRFQLGTTGIVKDSQGRWAGDMLTFIGSPAPRFLNYWHARAYFLKCCSEAKQE